MIEHCSFVEIGIRSKRIHSEQPFRQLEHVIGVARFRSFPILNIAFAVGRWCKMFTPTVSAQSKSACVHNRIPKKLRGLFVSVKICHSTVIAAQFRYPLVSHNLRHLSIGMFVVQIVLAFSHAVKKPMMRESFCRIKIFKVACHGTCIGINFVHSSEFGVEHSLHLFIAQWSNYCKSPIAQIEKHLLGIFIASVHPCIAQSGIRLVQIIPRHPEFRYDTDVTFLHFTPNLCTVRHSAYISIAVFLLTALQLAHHIIHTALALNVARSCIVYGKSRQVMSTDMSVKVLPILKTLSFRS